MIFAEIQVALINLTIGITLLILAIYYFIKSNERIILYLGIALGFFGSSNFFLLGSRTPILISTYILFRIIAYSLITIYCMLIVINKLLSHKKRNDLKQKIIYLSFPISFFIMTTIALYYFYTLYYSFSLNIFPRQHIYSLNAFYGVAIAVFAYLSYKIKKQKIYLFLSISFVLFALSHIAALFNIESKLTILFIIVRLAAYLFTILAIVSAKNNNFIATVNKFINKLHFQIFVTIISTLLLIIMFYIPQMGFNSSDPKIFIKPINPTISAEKTINIKTGIFIKNFPIFDITDNNFVMNAIVWFEFNPHLVSLESIEKFSFEKGTILKCSVPEIKIIGENLFARYKVKIKFQSNLNYDLFPLEDHTISIALINTYLNPKELVLTSGNSDLLIDDKVFTGNWKQTDSEVYYGYSISQIDKFNPQKTSSYPTVIFLIDFEKIGIKDSLIIFVPIYIALFLSIFSLLLTIENTKGILSLSVGSISALIFDLFILEKLTPNVSYFTLSDTIFTTLLVVVFIILLFNIFLIKVISQKKNIPQLVILRNYIFILLLLFIVLLTYYVIL